MLRARYGFQLFWEWPATSSMKPRCRAYGEERIPSLLHVLGAASCLAVCHVQAHPSACLEEQRGCLGQDQREGTLCLAQPGFPWLRLVLGSLGSTIWGCFPAPRTGSPGNGHVLKAARTQGAFGPCLRDGIVGVDSVLVVPFQEGLPWLTRYKLGLELS